MLTTDEIDWLYQAMPARVGAHGADLGHVEDLPFYDGGLLDRFYKAEEIAGLLLIGEYNIEDREIYALTGNSSKIHAAEREPRRQHQ